MKLAGNTITIFNAVHDTASDLDDYIPTVITGTTWHAQVVTAVDATGLKAASKYTVRVSITADTSGKAYADPVVYASAADKSAQATMARRICCIPITSSSTRLMASPPVYTQPPTGIMV